MPRRGSVAAALTSALKQFRKRRVAHIHESFSGEAAAIVMAMVEGMAKTLFDAGSSGIRKPWALKSITGKDALKEELGKALAEQLLDVKSKPGRFHADLELVIAETYSLHTDLMADRCLDLARIAVPYQPGEAVHRFLRRLGRCYVAGFDPETVIICRAVLENAVNEKFEREGRPLPTPVPGKSDMRAKLKRAEDHGWLSRRQSSDAMTIWDRGSTAAHRDPQVTTAVLETVAMTLGLLAALYVDQSPLAT